MTDKVIHAHFIWAGGEHRFALPLDERAIMWHQVRDPHARLRRLITGDWSVDDVVGTIRGGLVGGRSVRLVDVEQILSDHVHTRPLAENAALAKAILLVALFGIPTHLADVPVEAEAMAAMATDAHAAALGGGDE